MIARHVYLYLGSKLAAAVLTLAAMAVFVRMGGADLFGVYLIQFSLAYIAYGIAAQWMRFAFFNGFDPEAPGPWIATYLAAVAAAVALAGLVAALVALVGLAPPGMAAGVFVLTAGLAVYEALHEIGRTRLAAERVAVGALARAALMLGLGVAALSVGGDGTTLAIAVGAAHLLAATPLLPLAAPALGVAASRETWDRLWRYGRPLIPSSGLNMANMHADRLMLADAAGAGAVGPYGAASDFVRQGMTVISEAIAGAYMPNARRALAEGRRDDAQAMIHKAFLAFTALAAFGALAVARFDAWLFTLLFGAEIAAEIGPAATLIALANAAMVIRLYYFGQVIFLTDNAALRLTAEIAHGVVVVGLGLALIPSAGAVGAAAALLAGHVAGSAVYVRAWRGHYLLALPYAAAAWITGMAAAAYSVATVLEWVAGPGGVATALGLMVFAGAGLLAAWRYDILSARGPMEAAGRRARQLAGRFAA